jgi:hypothetical protein
MRTPTGSSRGAVLAASVAVAAALVAAPFAAGTARAQPPDATSQARQHFTRGKELYAGGEYRGAIAEFAAADKLAPSPLLEFNIALCHERLGERAEAVRRYKAYLERVPGADNRSAVEAKIGKLEAELKAEQQAKEPPRAAPNLVPPPVPGPDPGKAPDAAPPSTGDPDLDRVARIDIGKLRARRQAAGDQPPRRAGPPPSAPPPRAGPREPPPREPARAPRDEGEKKSRPLYKQWWFWVVAGVSAVIIVSIVTADSDGDDGRARMLPFGDAGRDVAQPGGAVLLRF